MSNDGLKLDYIMFAYFLNNKQYAMEISNSTTYEYFNIKVQWLYKAMTDHFTNPKFKEIPTVNIIEEYLNKNFTDAKFIKSGVELFNKISTIKVNPLEFSWNLEKLKMRYNEQVQRNYTISVSNLMKENICREDRVQKINEVMRSSITTIDSIHKRKAYKEGTLNESAKDRANYYKAVEANPVLAQGVLTGLTEFDRITNGLHGGELVLIGGRSSTGKSVLMHNVAVNAWLGGYNPLEPLLNPEEVTTGCNVLYFSIEMPKDNQERRLDSCMSITPYKEIRDGRLCPEDREKYLTVLEFQEKFPNKFHIVDMPRGVTAREVELKHVEMEEKYGIKFGLTVVDYIGIMSPIEKQKSDWENQGVIAEELHEYARAYNIPCLSAVQMNRPKDSNNEEHSINRVARSDMIPQNANIILQIGCRGEDEDTRLDMPVYIIKNRDGEKTSFTLIKNFPCMHITDMVDETFADGDDYDLGI